jgi:hypothetical protein
MRAVLMGAIVSVATLRTAGDGWACTIIERTELEKFMDQLNSKPVNVAQDCSMTNIGVGDFDKLSPAVNIGNGRVYQTRESISEGDQYPTSLFVTDCNARAVTYLRGPVIGSDELTCGTFLYHGDLIGPDGIVTLLEGRDLYELEAIVVAAGGSVLDPNEVFNETDWGTPVWRKERVSFTCGCRLFYPDSPGAD